jgi:lipopolysaccharide export system protein LptA
MSRAMRGPALALIVASLASASAMAAGSTKPAPAASGSSLLPGGNSKEPISIDADKLNYYDKEQKAIYTGNVVAIQGDTKMTCTVMTIFLAKADATAPGASGAAGSTPTPAPAAADAGAAPGGSQVRHMDATGPVTLVSKTQVATGDRASYDKTQNKVWLFGNVTLSDNGNVTKGDRLTYDLTSGEATVEVGKSAGRVHAQFIQGAGGADDADKPATPDKPAKKDKEKEAASAPSDKPKAAKKQAAGDTPPKP